MTQTATGSGRFSLPDAFSGIVGFAARLFIGLLLVLFAGLIALVTAFAEPLTLDARRTPRGWTVE